MTDSTTLRYQDTKDIERYPEDDNDSETGQPATDDDSNTAVSTDDSDQTYSNILSDKGSDVDTATADSAADTETDTQTAVSTDDSASETETNPPVERCETTDAPACKCVANTHRNCINEQGECAKGTQTCVPDGPGGSDWGVCDVQPAPTDTCENGNDANCNGIVHHS